jgi:DNA replication protein DnaC
MPEENEMSLAFAVDESLSVSTSEQYAVASQIIEAAAYHTDQFMFLQGSAGTGKTFTIKALIRRLQWLGKKCLICGTQELLQLSIQEEPLSIHCFASQLTKSLRAVSDPISAAVLFRPSISLMQI